MYIIKKLETEDELDQVYQLTYKMYLEEGYILPNTTGRLKHYEYLDRIPETTIFIITLDDKVVGTNSITIDNQLGLHVDCDKCFDNTISKIREKCKKESLTLGSSWRLITDHSLKNDPKIVLELMGKSLEFACKNNIHVALYTFNPKHEKFYSKILGLETIDIGKCMALDDTPPAILMYSDYRIMYEKWKRLCKSRHIEFKLTMIKYP